MATNIGAQKSGLRRMRRIATGVLAGLGCVFVGSHFVVDPSQSVLLIRAMAEAGMVGGLADWFAVEALFRRPLGLPIPHTALLPANQKRAAKNVGHFFETYFMDPVHMRKRLAGIDPGLMLGEWMLDHRNATLVARQFTAVFTDIFKSDLGAELMPQSGAFLQDILQETIDSDEIAAQVSSALKGALHGQILDDLLERIQLAVDANFETIVQMVHKRSRWWIAASIDEKIAETLVDGLISVLRELGQEGSALRADFENTVGKMVDGFQRDGVLATQIEKGKTGFLASPDFDELVVKMLGNMQAHVAETLEKDPDGIAASLTKPLQLFAEHLVANPEIRGALNAKIFDLAEIILVQLRPVVSTYVTETITDWDSAELVGRFENAVGRDLQFIRINGAVLGSLIGGALFFFGVFFG